MKVSKTTTPLSRRHASAAGLSIRFTDNGAVAQKWPKKRGPKRHPAERWWSDTWGTAAQMAAHPYHLDQSFAEAWTKGTPFAPRDLLTAAALGQLFEIVGPDGEIIESLLTVAGNPQQTLDLISNTPGAMLFRAPQGWIKVPPGIGGQWLRYLSTGEIIWSTPNPNGTAALPAPTLIGINADRTGVSLEATQNLAWDAPAYDTPGRFDVSANPTRITFNAADAGVIFNVNASLVVRDVGTGTTGRAVVQLLNAADTVIAEAGNGIRPAFTTDRISASLQTPIITEGDYLRWRIELDGDASVTVVKVGTTLGVTAQA